MADPDSVLTTSRGAPADGDQSGLDAPPAGARERILGAAYELFSRQGIQAVGIDAVISRSGVARQTLYRHFASKQALVLAFLERREEMWTKRWLKAEVRRRASEPRERLLAIFDVFDEWFRRQDFEGCSFINVMLEHADPNDPVHRAGLDYLSGIRSFLEGLARQAGIPNARGFRAAVAHPDERFDRRRRRGRHGCRAACQANRSDCARARR